MKKVALVILALMFVVSTSNAQKGAMKVEPSLVLAFAPSGYSTGFGANGTFFYGINKNIDLTGTIGYVTWGSDFTDVSLSTIPVLLGGRYSFEMDGAITPYAAAELGMHFVSSSYPWFDWTTGAQTTESVSSSEFGFGIGGGAYFNVGSLIIDANVEYNTMGSSNYLAVRAGVIFAL